MRLVNAFSAFVRDHVCLTGLVAQNVQMLLRSVVVLEAGHKATRLHHLV
jgi:hypothetical protein